MQRDAQQALTYLTKRCRACFTSFCKNEGTDLLIFFWWSGSKIKDEKGDGMDDTKERLIGKQNCHDLESLATTLAKIFNNLRMSQENLTITNTSQVSRWLLSSFLPCERQ